MFTAIINSKFFTESYKTLRLAIPLVISHLIYALSGFFGNVFVARLGSNELAAHGLVYTIFITLIMFFIGVLSAVNVLVAQSHGAQDEKGVTLATSQGFILALLFSLPMSFVMLLGPKILLWTGQSSALIKLATPYCYSFIWCMLPLNILIIIEQFFIGISRTKLVLFLGIIEVPLEILFFYLFIFGKFGFPKCGLSGIGYGFALAFILTDLALGSYLFLAQSYKKYQLFTNLFRWSKKFIFELCRLGIPMGIMFCVEMALFAMIALMMGKLGNNVLAAHQFTYQCYSFVLSIIFGLSQGTTVRIGHEVGRGNKDAISYIAFVNIVLGTVVMLLIGLVYVFLSNSLISLDFDLTLAYNQELIQLAKQLLLFAAILQIIDTMRCICVAALRGLKDTKVPLYISIISFWLVAFPLAYLFGFIFKLDGIGIWLGLIVGICSSAFILHRRLRKFVTKLDIQSLITRSN